MNRNCSSCNIKIVTKNYKKYRSVCKSYYNKNKRKNNNNIIFTPIQQTKIEIEYNNNNSSLIIGFSSYGKTSNEL